MSQWTWKNWEKLTLSQPVLTGCKLKAIRKNNLSWGLGNFCYEWMNWLGDRK
jgi:hypothetical protein